MCGIFCAVGDMVAKQDRFISDMFVLDSLRGPHSCGLLSVVNYNSEVGVYKKAMQAHDYLDMAGYKKALAGKNKVLVGHNRWATKGKINNINAHPFTVGNITGVHNGTLTQQSLLPDHASYEVDSENIIHSIDKIGIVETWAKIKGAAALMWWDAEEDSFNFIRNKERPLFFCYSKDLKQMYAASEYYMLAAGLWRNGIEHYDIEELPVNELYSFRVETGNKIAANVVKCSTLKVQPYKAPVYQSKRGKKGRKYDDNVTNFNKKKTGYDNFLGKIGDVVDFIVTSVVYYHKLVEYEVADNATGELYRINDYSKIPILKVNECATAIIHRFSGRHIYLNSATLKFNSEYEYNGDTTTKALTLEEDIESKRDKEWEKQTNHDCDLCGSPVSKTEEYLATTEGQLFCSVCKTDELVKDYTVNKETEH